MNGSNKRLGQRLIAIVVIIAVLEVVGVPPAVIVFLLISGLVIWRMVRRYERLETRRIFEFFLAADEILRDETRKWYGFEISEVIGDGERILLSMPDPPALTRFALGALYYRVDDFEPGIEHLAWTVDDNLAAERHLTLPSPQLRRYVETLRRIEHDPAIAPQTLAAVRSLERTRVKRAREMLVHSRQRLQNERADTVNTAAQPDTNDGMNDVEVSFGGAPKTPPSISDVLREVYRSDRNTTI